MSFGHTRKSIHRVRTHYLWEQNHSTKADETRNTPVHTQGTPRQGEMPPKGKEHYIWPKRTYGIQQLIEKCIICQEYGKSQPILGTTQELLPFP